MQKKNVTERNTDRNKTWNMFERDGKQSSISRQLTICQVLFRSPSFGYGCFMVAVCFVTVCHDFSSFPWQVNVSSGFITVLSSVLLLPAVLLRSDTVPEVAEEERNVDPGREVSFKCMCVLACVYVLACVCMRVCVLSCTNMILISWHHQKPADLCQHSFQQKWYRI